MAEKWINWGLRATIVALVANSLLIFLKIVIGILINSLSLVADGFDSSLDVFTALLAFIGFRLAKRPPDESHHYGHHQLEALLSLSITGIMFLSAFVILTQGITRLIQGIQLEFNAIGLMTAIISIMTKITIAQYIIRAGKLAESPAIIANGKNYRTDALTSTLVALAIVGSFFGLGWLDILIALIICIFIFHTGLEIAKSSLTSLLDMAPPKSVISDVSTYMDNIPGIREVHDLRLRYLGNTITGDCHILVDPTMTIEAAHDLAEKVERLVENEFGINDLIVHLEPFTSKESKQKCYND